MSEFQRILSSASIEQIVAPHVELKKTGKTLSGCCPFHKEKTPSFNVYPENNTYHCFGCGANGDCVNFLNELLGVEPLEALKMIASISGVAPPEMYKKPASFAAKDQTLQKLWDVSVDPAPSPTNFVTRLEKAGWPARPYQPRALQSAAAGMGSMFHKIADCGLPLFQRSTFSRPVDAQTFPPQEGGFVLAGRKLGMNDNMQPTGFVVMSVAANGAIQILRRLEAEASPPSVIATSAACGNRLNIENLFISDNPTRAMRANRTVPAAFPAAPTWRTQDIRCIRSAFPNATLIIDANGFSDKSWNTLVRQMGAAFNRVQVGGSLSDISGIVPALDFRVLQLVSNWKALQDNSEIAPGSAAMIMAQERAQAFLDAMATIPAMRLVCGQHMADAGLPVQYGPVNDPSLRQVAPRAPRSLSVIGEKARKADENKFSCPEYWLHTLDPALVDLPYLNVTQWEKIPSEKFGDHAPIARAMTAFLRDPSTSQLPTDRYHSAFWTFAARLTGQHQVPAPLIDHWRKRMAGNSDFWEQTHIAGSSLYKQSVDRVSRSMALVLHELEKEIDLQDARLASLDPEYEEQLRAKSLARLGVTPAAQQAPDYVYESEAHASDAPGTD